VANPHWVGGYVLTNPYMRAMEQRLPRAPRVTRGATRQAIQSRAA
jgi:hypothetical protein